MSTTGVDDLQSAQTAALGRAKGAVSARNEKRAALVLQLPELRAYVQTVANESPDRLGGSPPLRPADGTVCCASARWRVLSSGRTLFRMSESHARLPALYLPHGGGPWPFVDLGAFVEPGEVRLLSDYLRGVAATLPRRPSAMVVVSAHWEARVPTVMTSATPPIYYDYYGFPPESYAITWPAPGNPRLAGRVRELLDRAGIESAEDADRGFDHGTFIPLKLTFPEADVPTIQLSLQEGLDPARHFAMGRALAPLRDEGVLLVGSGMSYHNMRGFKHPQGRTDSEVFDAWLQRAAVSEPGERDASLTNWAGAPAARRAHPREEHLLPLMVMAGAAGTDRGRVTFAGTFGGARISGVHFGG